MRLTPILAALLISSSSVAIGAGTSGEVAANGFVFAGPQGAKLREGTSVDAKVLVTAPPGTKLAYRRYYEIGGERTWYYVTFPGKPAGWVAGKDVATKRSTTPPPGKAIELKSSGLGDITVTASMTAAARGLDARAKKYGETSNLKPAADQFVTLENQVGAQFGDKPDAKGQYDDQKEHAGRKNAAKAFKAGVR